MRILVTGRGKGSWQVRGEQIGAAIGARVVPMASLAEMRAADVILVVKRTPGELVANLHAARRPWVYDIVDAYPQPLCSYWSRAESIAWVRQHLASLRPTAVVWPNLRMRSDAGAAGPVVYHHHRPRIARNPVRERIETIGYEGSESYIEGGWRQAIEAECRRRGARFVVNPAQLAELDVVLAVRSGVRNGYAQRHWKSNVKLANAHASGTPFIGAPECGYEETATGCEYWAETPRMLSTALDWIEGRTARQAISARFLQAAIPVESAAAQVLEALRCAAKS